MRGAPRKNMDVNFLEIWRNAQSVDHDIESAKPADSVGRDGEVRGGLLSDDTFRIYIKLGGQWREVTVT